MTTYPSPKSTLTPISHLGQNCDLEEGKVVSYPETSIDPIQLPINNNNKNKYIRS